MNRPHCSVCGEELTPTYKQPEGFIIPQLKTKEECTRLHEGWLCITCKKSFSKEEFPGNYDVWSR